MWIHYQLLNPLVQCNTARSIEGTLNELQKRVESDFQPNLSFELGLAQQRFQLLKNRDAIRGHIQKVNDFLLANVGSDDITQLDCVDPIMSLSLLPLNSKQRKRERWKFKRAQRQQLNAESSQS